ncbi:hypothetical protein HT031_000102 [Scenedesmus sp. PABB004]|nr:hypothetical protein HT031_000102 [Scenedesmus sp. PABB004]
MRPRRPVVALGVLLAVLAAGSRAAAADGGLDATQQAGGSGGSGATQPPATQAQLDQAAKRCRVTFPGKASDYSTTCRVEGCLACKRGGGGACLCCEAGRSLSADGRSCTQCPVGRFLERPDAAKACKRCTGGTTNAKPGSTSCPVCVAGFKFVRAGVCSPCARGSYSAGAGAAQDCAPCPPGFTTPLGKRGTSRALCTVPTVEKCTDLPRPVTGATWPAKCAGSVSCHAACSAGFTGGPVSAKCVSGAWQLQPGLQCSEKGSGQGTLLLSPPQAAAGARETLVFSVDLTKSQSRGAKVKLYASDTSGRLLDVLADLYDDGKPAHKDVAKGDGVFTNVVRTKLGAAGVQHYAATVTGTGTSYTLRIALRVVEPPSRAEARAGVRDAAAQQEQINSLLSQGGSITTAVSQVASVLQAQPEVDSVEDKGSYVAWSTTAGLGFVAGKRTSIADSGVSEAQLRRAAEAAGLLGGSSSRATPQDQTPDIGDCKLAKGDVMLLSPVLTPLHVVISSILIAKGYNVTQKCTRDGCQVLGTAGGGMNLTDWGGLSAFNLVGLFTDNYGSDFLGSSVAFDATDPDMLAHATAGRLAVDGSTGQAALTPQWFIDMWQASRAPAPSDQVVVFGSLSSTSPDSLFPAAMSTAGAGFFAGFTSDNMTPDSTAQSDLFSFLLRLASGDSVEPPTSRAALSTDNVLRLAGAPRSSAAAPAQAAGSSQFVVTPLRDDGVVEVRLIDRCECLGLPQNYTGLRNAAGPWPATCAGADHSSVCEVGCTDRFIGGYRAACDSGEWRIYSDSGCTAGCFKPPPDSLLPRAAPAWNASCAKGTRNNMTCPAACVDSEGFTYSGVAQALCVDGAWSPTLRSTCIKTSCSPDNGVAFPAPQRTVGWWEACSKGTQVLELPAGFECSAACEVPYDGGYSTTCKDGAWTPVTGNCTIDTCTSPPENGTVPLNSEGWDRACRRATEYSICTAKCSPGFTGGYTAQCTASGWAPRTGSCTFQKTCASDPGRVKQLVDSDGWQAGCDDGAALGEECLAPCKDAGCTGGVTTTAPNTTAGWPAVCGASANATQLFESGYECEAACARGFQGKVVSQCTSAGWSEPIGTCLKFGCYGYPDPVAPSNSTGFNESCFGAAPGRVCRAPCVRGYTGAGYSAVCLSDNTWSSVTGSCKLVTCAGPPPDPAAAPNATLGWAGCDAGGAEGDTCRAACARGYTGGFRSQCLNSTWTAPAGACVARFCPMLRTTPPANTTGWGDDCRNASMLYPFGWTCTANCSTGAARPPAAGARRGGAAGALRARAAPRGAGRARAAAPRALPPRPGFEGDGYTTRCLNNTAWAEPAGSPCVQKFCAALPWQQPANSTGWDAACSTTNATAQHPQGTNCTAQCSTGYVGLVSTTCGTNNAWSAPSGSCRQNFCAAMPLPTPANTVAWDACTNASAQYAPGTTCTAACVTGWNGTVSSTCTNNAWTAPTGACVKVFCDPLLSPAPGGTLGWDAGCTASMKFFGQSCFASCGGGLAGLFTATCRSTGWEISGACAASVCSSIPASQSTALPWPSSCSNSAPGASCTAQCNNAAGYYGTGLTSTCSGSVWSAPSGSCVLRQCTGQPSTPPAGTAWPAACNNGPANLQCTANCTAGYDAPVSASFLTATCQPNQTWTAATGDPCTLGTNYCNTTSPLPVFARFASCTLPIGNGASCAAPCRTDMGVSFGGGGYTVTCTSGAWGTPTGACNDPVNGCTSNQCSTLAGTSTCRDVPLQSAAAAAAALPYTCRCATAWQSLEPTLTGAACKPVHVLVGGASASSTGSPLLLAFDGTSWAEVQPSSMTSLPQGNFSSIALLREGAGTASERLAAYVSGGDSVFRLVRNGSGAWDAPAPGGATWMTSPVFTGMPTWSSITLHKVSAVWDGAANKTRVFAGGSDPTHLGDGVFFSATAALDADIAADSGSYTGLTSGELFSLNVSANYVWAARQNGIVSRLPRNGSLDFSDFSSSSVLTSAALYGVAALSDDDVWVVGGEWLGGGGANDLGCILARWDGLAWELVPSCTTALRAISMYDWRTGYAVGDAGAIYKWDGVAWAPDALFASQVSSTANLYGVKVIDPWHVVVVGDQVLATFNGTAWSQPDITPLFGTTGPASGTTYVLGAVDAPRPPSSPPRPPTMLPATLTASLLRAGAAPAAAPAAAAARRAFADGGPSLRDQARDAKEGVKEAAARATGTDEAQPSVVEKMREGVGKVTERLGEMFKDDGAVGKQFTPEGSVGGTAQEVGGPLDKEGPVGHAFTSEGAVGGNVERAAEALDEKGERMQQKAQQNQGKAQEADAGLGQAPRGGKL